TVARWQAQYETTKNEIFFRIEDALTDLRRLEDQIDLLLSGIIPEAELSLESARSVYTTAEVAVDFGTVLDAQVALYKAQLAYYGALSAYEKRLADLEAVVGHRLH
ncbi:MAG: TolC family protein, partial [Armatimonadota bacterium]